MREQNSNSIGTGESLPLAESFYSIQGEGYNTGKPAFFIRLGGCDVRCPWCDSKSTWDRSAHPTVPVGQILALVEKTPAVHVVITGGEPLMYNLEPLCSALKEKHLSVFLETSGTHPLSGDFDWICVSPKRHRPPLSSTLEKASELKVVVSGSDDFAWAEENRKHVPDTCLLYLQPNWEEKETAQELIVEYVKQNPLWRISLQTHKFMNIQ